MGWARFELPRENHNAGLVHFVSSRLFELKLSPVELRPMGEIVMGLALPGI